MSDQSSREGTIQQKPSYQQQNSAFTCLSLLIHVQGSWFNALVPEQKS